MLDANLTTENVTKADLNEEDTWALSILYVAYAYTIANAEWKNSDKNGQVIFEHEVEGLRKGPWEP